MSKLVIAGREFNSRLFLGTGKFNNNDLMARAIEASQTEMVTVAMKRIELEDKQDDLLTHITQNKNIQLLPNTSGVRNAEEAVFAAQMAREAFGTNWLKLCFLTAKQIPRSANIWKKQAPPLSCLWQHPSARTRDCA